MIEGSVIGVTQRKAMATLMALDAVKRMKESERRWVGEKKPRPTALLRHRPEYLMQQGSSNTRRLLVPFTWENPHRSIREAGDSCNQASQTSHMAI